MANTGSVLQTILYYTHPHVNVTIKDNTGYDESGIIRESSESMPYSTLAVFGADKGIDNVFVCTNDLNMKKSIFGEGNYSKYGQPSLQADALFNGHTNVWLCRVLPDNAQYANLILLAHFRKGKILDELNQETGKYRLEIKFSIENVTSKNISGGATKDDIIDNFAQSFMNDYKSDPQTGYITIPIGYSRIIGRGKYGNMYSLSIDRDMDAEKEYNVKMYKFKLIDNSEVTRVVNEFSGSLVPYMSKNTSTLIDDVIDQYSLGSCPIKFHAYYENIEKIYNFYKENIVAENRKYLNKSGATINDLEELQDAQSVTIEKFDPIFGYIMNTKINGHIPYYRNYTISSNGGWVRPQLEIPNTSGATKPLNLKDWSAAYIGAKVLVAADPLNGGHRWLYTVTNIDTNNGNILYDEGVETDIDADQYDGVNLNISIGQSYDGGSDGDFEQITVNGITRTPNSSELKLLLAREYVKAFRGNKDRRILSPARINLDFIFDANYNMTSDETIEIQDNNIPLYNNSTVLTDKEAAALSVLTMSNPNTFTYTDLNVKQAMYDLNEFRCKNGMTINPERGSGTLLMLDMGLVGLKNTDTSKQLDDLIKMMDSFTGRQTTVDLGYFDVIDPYSGKKVPVTVLYHIAKNYVNHILRNGLNKPYTHNYSQITCIQNNISLLSSGEMVRDSFKPDIDLIDWDVKEKLYKSRINYWLTIEEGRIVQRECQNTRELDASALLEENNVRILNTLKKTLEKSCRGYSYAWNEPEVRKSYTNAQMAKFRPWIGTIVQDISINFTANEWEQERMIMHCFVSVKFRDIVKRIILEININRPTYID